MSSIEKYIEKIKQEISSFSDIEKLRYVYLDLGKRFQFDLNFAFGNSKKKKSIYALSRSKDELNSVIDSNIGICKSISYTFEYIIKELGIDIKTIIDPLDSRKISHMYNVVTTSTGDKYRFDLQEDMRFIKAHLRTKYFGVSMKDNNKTIISRHDLDQIDKKLGYITGDLYYTDEYLELIKINMSLFENFGEKVQFVLENSEAYTSKDMGYADRRWRIEDLIGSSYKQGLLFSYQERKKIHMIDCYREILNGEKSYELCIAVDVGEKTDIYMFSEETNSFEKKTLDEFAELIENGLVNMEGINGLKKVLNQRKNRDREI